MTDFRNVLVATDFSEPAARAVDFAVELARKFDARLTLLHVYHIPTQAYAYEVVMPLEAFAKSAQKQLDAELAGLRMRYPNCEGLVELGRPAERIVATADKRSVGVIVMGTHGRRAVSRFLLGSVAERVVRTSKVPVLTVPSELSETIAKTGTAT